MEHLDFINNQIFSASSSSTLTSISTTFTSTSMAYANAPLSEGAPTSWLTSRVNVLTFSGDYREHTHVEDSTLPLYQHQPHLPSLPVTTLAQSAKIYLQSILPLTTKDEYNNTKRAVDEFLCVGGRGHELQRRLEQRKIDCEGSSWLQEWWNKGSYLE